MLRVSPRQEHVHIYGTLVTVAATQARPVITCPGVQWGSCLQVIRDCNKQLLKGYPTRAAGSHMHFLLFA